MVPTMAPHAGFLGRMPSRRVPSAWVRSCGVLEMTALRNRGQRSGCWGGAVGSWGGRGPCGVETALDLNRGGHRLAVMLRTEHVCV